jgi:hypothetical protein
VRSTLAVLARRPVVGLSSALTATSFEAFGFSGASLMSRLPRYADDGGMWRCVGKQLSAFCGMTSDPSSDIAAFSRRVLLRELWEHQLEAAASDRFITAVAAARRTGKMVLAETLAMHTAFSHRGCRVLVLSATQDAARRVTESIGQTLNASHLTRGAVVDDFATRIRLTNRGEIISLPASQRQVRGYGAGVLLVILDEAGFMPGELWQAASLGMLLIFLMPSDFVITMTTGVHLESENLPYSAALPFIGLTMLIAALPLGFYLLFRRRAMVGMPKLRDWMNANSALVNIAVYVIFIVMIVS